MEENNEKTLQELVESTQPQDLTLQQLKSYMRIDFVDEENDQFISTLLYAAKSFVQTYLGWTFKEWTGGEVPSEITIAVLAISEHWYKNRGILTEDTSKEELPFVFSGILDMHRNWQISTVDNGGDN